MISIRFHLFAAKWIALLGILFSFLLPTQVQAQKPNDVVKWKFESKKVSENTYDIIGTATITRPDFHIWTFNPGGKDGELPISLIPTTIKVSKNPDIKMMGKVKAQGNAKTRKDEMMGTLNYYEGSAKYIQRIEALKNTTVKGVATFQTCNESGCLPPTDVPFEIKLTDVVEKADTTAKKDSVQKVVDSTALTATDSNQNVDTTANLQAADTNATSTLNATNNNPSGEKHNEDLDKKSNWQLFLMGFFWGLIAFIMPCIYAMLPVTVSFFTKRSKDKATGIRNAIVYALSIILIFVAIGALISLLFTQKTMYEISSSIWFNLFVFVIFVVFGISLLGAFEITLPSSLSNAMDKKANSKNIGGIFFMALVLVIVSFSCTSAFISNLIVYIFSSGNNLGGVIGFLGFGLAIALPFALGALFPGMINNMAKSGGWLNAVKVTMGILELAMALKFLSNVDLAYHWRLLDVEVFLSIWIILFGILGLYLLGKIKFSHDEELPKNMFGQPYVGVVRLFFAIASLAFTVYLIPGLWGAPLNAISGFLPESKTHDFNLKKQLTEIQIGSGGSGSNGSHGDEVMPVKYTQTLHSELPGIHAFFDYEEALAAAKKTGKPVLLDFTGHSCINCRKMEKAVLNQPQILRLLKENFIVASLYVDDSSPLPKEEQYNSKLDGKLMKTLGDKNLDLELLRFNSVMQPLYVFVDADGNVIENAGGYVNDVARFQNIIMRVLEKHKAKQ